MFKFFSLFLIAGTLSVTGCESSSQPQTVTTNQDDIEAYEKMIESDQEATENDTATEDSR
ncbi:MAG: hypothetical protein CMM01_23160 [Rhodopirellula sp.]|nr:hypothetical protein [Rhodopirellula sp.]